jgi:hypothetical protein
MTVPGRLLEEVFAMVDSPSEAARIPRQTSRSGTWTEVQPDGSITFLGGAPDARN